MRLRANSDGTVNIDPDVISVVLALVGMTTVIIEADLTEGRMLRTIGDAALLNVDKFRAARREFENQLPTSL